MASVTVTIEGTTAGSGSFLLRKRASEGRANKVTFTTPRLSTKVGRELSKSPLVARGEGGGQGLNLGKSKTRLREGWRRQYTTTTPSCKANQQTYHKTCLKGVHVPARKRTPFPPSNAAAQPRKLKNPCEENSSVRI
ncbi:uncharacterized protein PGTG_02656 [Puccinia graminis f. sp. tritici CRL 75-36-700-3]|uniref:Uncharacterized protein n=1 Tax=Puccinia graminis f. sp. tritici (strain CRL 75-36-700-3 / race SCCL) TaxID=418459 RepID=E3JVZ0_PUCGT|nr:uncharacterized protein PGTG_02656 [Puccinia graminis f. sp. tritici CRL 75-36-700-3]EFP76215.1 hypothetical protein PGTG_02656 [Puccinia graminis f. sp. tritici CRL 75-36-700-3]